MIYIVVTFCLIVDDTYHNPYSKVFQFMNVRAKFKLEMKFSVIEFWNWNGVIDRNWKFIVLRMIRYRIRYDAIFNSSKLKFKLDVNKNEEHR